MASWAKPGVKVVCVDASPCAWAKLALGLAEGAVYTVRAVCPVDRYGTEGVSLVEVASSSERFGSGKFGFRISRFRPLVTKTQQEDVELFRHLLTSTDMSERV